MASDDARDLTLACSEACANAVEHPCEAARQAFELAGRLVDGGVEIAVRDWGAWRLARAADSTRGRGLDMIREVMDDVQVERDGNGTRVTMRRRLAGRADASVSPSAPR